MAKRLNEEEKQLKHKALVASRYLAVKAMIEKGLTIEKACNRSGFDRSYYYRYFSKYQQKILEEIIFEKNRGYKKTRYGKDSGLRTNLLDEDDDLY
jgi:hypothetical protein